MTDLARQLRAYVDGVAEPVTADEARQQAGGPRRRSFVAAVALVAVLVAVVAGVVVAVRLGSDGDRTNGVVAGRPTESAAPGEPSGDDLASGWQRVDFVSAGLPAGATIFDVEHGHGVFVAVGEVEGGAAAWSSPDGWTWTVRLGAGGEISGFLKLVAASPDGFTTLGGDETGWYSYRSPDGLTWERAAAGPEVLPEAPTAGAEFALAGTSDSGDLVAGDGGLVLLSSGFAVSADGRTFEPVSPPLEDADRDFKAITPTDRGFVALGTAVRSGGLDTIVWSSPDGVRWTRDGSVVGSEGIATALAAEGDTLLAAKQIVGGDHAGEAWRSDDAGLTWEEQPAFADEFPLSTIRDLVRAGDVWVAVGVTDREEGEVADAWVSPDGSTWVAMPPELQSAGRLRVAATDGGVVVAPGRAHLYLWALPAPSTTTGGEAGEAGEAEIRERCDAAGSIEADIDGDGRADRAYHRWTEGTGAWLGVCTGAGVVDEVEGYGQAGVFFAADVQGDGRDELFYGDATANTDTVRLAVLVDGELLAVRLAGGEELEVRSGRVEGSGELRGFGCLDVEGAPGELVEIVFGEPTDRVGWERTAYRIEGAEALVTRLDRGDLPAPLDREDARALGPGCYRAITADASSGAATTAWRTYDGFRPGDPSRDTDDGLRDYVEGLLEMLRTMETPPNTVDLVSLDEEASTATAVYRRRTFDDDSVSGQDIRVHLRRGPNGWYVESAEVRDICARALGTDGLCL